jgi:hypothetical protein
VHYSITLALFDFTASILPANHLVSVIFMVSRVKQVASSIVFHVPKARQIAAPLFLVDLLVAAKAAKGSVARLFRSLCLKKEKKKLQKGRCSRSMPGRVIC